MERITHTLNHAQARLLFDTNAVYFYGGDAVPYKVTAELFGDEIAAAARRYAIERIETKSSWNYFQMVGGGSMKIGECFPILGFLHAVSLHNTDIIGRDHAK